MPMDPETLEALRPHMERYDAAMRQQSTTGERIVLARAILAATLAGNDGANHAAAFTTAILTSAARAPRVRRSGEYERELLARLREETITEWGRG